MTFKTGIVATLIIGSALLLSSCSILDSGAKKRKAEREEDRAGRIDLALGDQRLEADPAYVGTAIILPEMTEVRAWRQSGARASKASAHLNVASDLEIAWRVNAADGSDRKSALTSPPVSDGDFIYIIDGEQKVKAFSVEDGSRVWTVQLRSGSRRDKRGLGGGVAVVDETIVVSSGFGFVAALDRLTGEEKWRRALGAPVSGAPTIRGNQIFVVTQNNEVFALDLDDGTVEWSDQAIAESARVLAAPSPAAIEDLVVAPFSSGEVIAYLASNGRRLWNDALNRTGRFTPISTINDIASRPILNGGLVFAASHSGIMVAIDGRTGQRVWGQAIGSLYAPAVVGEYIFVSGVEGEIACLTRDTGAVIWATQLEQFEKVKKKRGRISYAGPIIANNRLLVASSDGDLIAISPQTGEETQRVRLGGTVFLEPIAVGDKLIILTDEGRLIAIR